MERGVECGVESKVECGVESKVEWTVECRVECRSNDSVCCFVGPYLSIEYHFDGRYGLL